MDLKRIEQPYSVRLDKLTRLSTYRYLLGFPGLFLHALAQAERAHVSPYFADVIEALLFAARGAFFVPAKREFFVGWPYRVLFLVVSYDLIDCLIFGLVLCHASLLVAPT
jgi:hypothetical protein